MLVGVLLRVRVGGWCGGGVRVVRGVVGVLRVLVVARDRGQRRQGGRRRGRGRGRRRRSGLTGAGGVEGGVAGRRMARGVQGVWCRGSWGGAGVPRGLLGG